MPEHRAVAPQRSGTASDRCDRINAGVPDLAQGAEAIGSAILPPLASPNSPDGELIAGFLPNGALIAFYRSIEKAERLEPAVLRNARRLHSQVERAGAVTIFWVRPPSATLRGAVQACLPDA